MDEVSIDAHLNHLNIIGVVMLITGNSLIMNRKCVKISVFNQCI